MRTNAELLYPQLSYDIIGACFDAFHEVGSGSPEKHYQKAVAACLEKRGIPFEQQVHCPITCRTNRVGDYYMDFVVGGKIVLELKAGGRFRRIDYDQVKEYLRKSGYELGLLVRFDENGVTFHRILRPHD